MLKKNENCYLIKINYNSGHSEEFWCLDYLIAGGKHNWTSLTGFKSPLRINVDAIESIWIEQQLTVLELYKSLNLPTDVLKD